MFTNDQVKELSADLSRSHVKERKQAGRVLSYIEGWHAIAEANRIFGFGQWSSETIETRLVSERERKVGSASADGWSVSYVCKVRVRVGDVIREGVGAGHGIDRDIGLAHESAVKEAETDARKRALMTFGNPFGLALYDKDQASVSDPVRSTVNGKAGNVSPADRMIEAIKKHTDEPSLQAWWDNRKVMDAFEKLPQDDKSRVVTASDAQFNSFNKEAA